MAGVMQLADIDGPVQRRLAAFISGKGQQPTHPAGLFLTGECALRQAASMGFTPPYLFPCHKTI